MSEALKLTAQMIGCRDAAKAIFGDGYLDAIAPAMQCLKRLYDHEKRPILSIAIEAGQLIEAEGLLLWFAAAVELIETGQAPLLDTKRVVERSGEHG